MARLIEKLDGLKMVDNSQYIFELQSNLEPVHTEALTTTIIGSDDSVHKFAVKEYGYVEFAVTDQVKTLVDLSTQLGNITGAENSSNKTETYYLYVKNTGDKVVQIGLGATLNPYAHLEPGAIMLLPTNAVITADIKAQCPTTSDTSTLACYLFGENVSVDATNNDFS